MTRKEERIEASIDYQMSTNPMALGGAAFEDMIRKMNVNHSFVAGAEWADEHPKKGMVSIDKARKWLQNNKEHPFIDCEDCCLAGYLTDAFIEEFCKAMEE